MISTIHTLTLISTRNSRIVALAVLLVTMRFPAPASASVDPPLHITAIPHLHFLVNVTVKHVWIPTEHLLNDLFPLLFVAMIIVTRETVAFAAAVSLVLETLTVELQAVTPTTIAGDTSGSGSRRRVARACSLLPSFCGLWCRFGSGFRFWTKRVERCKRR